MYNFKVSEIPNYLVRLQIIILVYLMFHLFYNSISVWVFLFHNAGLELSEYWDTSRKFTTSVQESGIAQSVQLRATGWAAEISFSVGERYFSLHSIQTSSGTHPASYPVGTGNSLSGVKQPSREAELSPPSSVNVKNGKAVFPQPHSSSWSGA
jgi:hypothetical protein